MKAFLYASLGVLAACATEQQQAERAAENVREEAGEARQEIGREVQEGREEVAEARKNLAEELRDMERSGEAVEFDAVVTGHDNDTVNLRLENGETFDVDYGTTSKFRRGADTVMINDLAPGQIVHVTYRIIDGKRMVDTIEVTEAPGTPGTDNLPDANMPGDNTPGVGGGTR